VFEANPLTMVATSFPTDKDGYPVPLSTEDGLQLHQVLRETYDKARKTYFEHMGALGLDKLTEVKTSVDEETE